MEEPDNEAERRVKMARNKQHMRDLSPHKAAEEVPVRTQCQSVHILSSACTL